MADKDPVLVISSGVTSLTRLSFVPMSLVSAMCLVVGGLSGEAILLVIAAGAALSAALSYSRYWRLKDIWVDGETVYASSFRRTITFPVSAIAAIETRRFRPNTGFMYLKQPTAFGDFLIFESRGFNTIRSSPVVAELLARARAVSAGPKIAAVSGSDL
jgi:hypothetical protein